MPRKNPLVKPLNMLKDTALGAVKDPRGAAEKVVGQARGTVAFGKVVVEGLAEHVAARTRSRTARTAPRAESAHLHSVPAEPATEPPAKKQGDPVAPGVDHEPAPAAKKPSPADVAKKAAKKAPAKKTPAKKTAKKAPAKKTAKKTPPKKASSGPPGDKLPPRKQAPERPVEQAPPPPHEPNPEAGA